MAVVPEQEIGCAGEHAHALELRAGDLVAALAIRGMGPEHAGLGAQTQMFDHGAVNLPFGRCEAAAGAAHGTPFGTGFACGKRYAAGTSPVRASVSIPRDADQPPPTRLAGKSWFANR